MIKTRKALILPIAIIACVLTFYVFLLFAAPAKVASADTVTVGGKTVTAVEWQCKQTDGDSYVWQTYVTSLQLGYKAADLSDSVRAVLTFDDSTTGNVYAHGVETDDAAAVSDLHLEFAGTFNGDAVTTPYNAATYAVTLMTADAQVLGDYSTTLEVTPAVLDITAADLEWSDDMPERPWLVDIEGVTTTLLDRGIKFYDPEADDNIGTGTEDDAYVAYRRINTSLFLNGDYVIGERTLQTYLNDAEITYTGNAAVGESAEVNTVNTIARLTFNGNYVSGTELELEKTWYIVTVNNALRSGDGSETLAFDDLHFGDENELVPMRGEHGDTVVYMVKENGATSNADGFAAVFGDDGIKYYAAKRGAGSYEADLTVPLDGDYYNMFFYKLGAGDYDLTVYLPEYRIQDEHTHWWNDGAGDETELYVVYHATQFVFNFSVYAYALDDGNGGFNAGVVLEFTDGIGVTYYNGEENNVPALTITLNGKRLVDGVDYELLCSRVDVGEADLTILGIGGLEGTVELKRAFHILQAANRWIDTPNVVNWIYGSFDPIVNTITATPAYQSTDGGVKFAVTTDRAGENVVEGLNDFGFTNGALSDEVLKLLRGLNVGSYYLFARVDETDNYTGLDPRGVAFRVFRAVNMWSETPHISSWVDGAYNPTDNAIKFGSLYGQARIVIKDRDGKVYYDSTRLIDNLKNAGVGMYTLTAVVDGAANYSALAEYTFNFEIYAKQGMPWWGVLLIVLGVIAVIAIVILILLKVGVIQLLTSKVAVKMRTNASIDATIAAIRVAKTEEEAKASIAKAKAKDRAKERRAAAKNTTADEKAAAAEAKAHAAAERAEKARIRAEVLQEKAARMRMTADEGAAPSEPAPENVEPTTGGEAPQTEQPTPSEE